MNRQVHSITRYSFLVLHYVQARFEVFMILRIQVKVYIL